MPASAENTTGQWIDGADGTRVWQPTTAPRGPARARARRPLSEEEIRERAALKRHRQELRDREVKALEELAGPGLRVETDPGVQRERAIALDARTTAGRELVRIERKPGTTLRLHARSYDGAKGNAPKFYALASIWFRTSMGSPFRSKGIAVEGPELRTVGEALVALAVEYEAACAEGIEPWARGDGAWKPPEPALVAAPVDGQDCPSCGAELPAHLDGCSGELAEPAPVVQRPRARRATEPTVIVTAATKEAAIALAARLQGEDLCAGGPYTSAPVIQITRLDSAACVALVARLEGEGFRCEVKS